MNKYIEFIATLCVFAVTLFLVYIAGQTAMSDEPLLALVPVAASLIIVVIYIRINDRHN